MKDAEFKDIEKKLKQLGRHINRIEQDKLPPSALCLYIFEKLPDYHENVLSKEEREDVEEHLKKCLWCFNSYMKYSISEAQARAGTVEEAPPWVKDVGREVFEKFSLVNRILMLHALGRFLRIRIRAPRRGLREVKAGKATAEEKTKKEYCIDEQLEVEFSGEKEGYLTIIHWDAEGKVELIVPHKENKETFIKKGEPKKITGRATLPLGNAGFKAFFTEKKLIDPEKIDYQDKNEIKRFITEFLETIERLPKDEWSEVMQEYIVIERSSKG